MHSSKEDDDINDQQWYTLVPLSTIDDTQFEELSNPTIESIDDLDLPDLCTVMRSKNWQAAAEMVKRNPAEARREHIFDIDGRTKALPLHFACFHKAPTDVIRTFHKAYPESIRNKDEKWGRLPIHIACMSNLSSSAIKYFIEKYVESVKIRDKKNRTALHYACISGKAAVVKLLLDVYPEGRRDLDQGGKTPSELAQLSDNPVKAKIVKFLKKYNNGDPEPEHTNDVARGTLLNRSVSAPVCGVKKNWDSLKISGLYPAPLKLYPSPSQLSGVCDNSDSGDSDVSDSDPVADSLHITDELQFLSFYKNEDPLNHQEQIEETNRFLYEGDVNDALSDKPMTEQRTNFKCSATSTTSNFVAVKATEFCQKPGKVEEIELDLARMCTKKDELCQYQGVMSKRYLKEEENTKRLSSQIRSLRNELKNIIDHLEKKEEMLCVSNDNLMIKRKEINQNQQEIDQMETDILFKRKELLAARKRS